MSDFLSWLGTKIAELTAGGPEGWFYASKTKLKFGTANKLIESLKLASEKMGLKDCTAQAETKYKGSCRLELAYCNPKTKDLIVWMLFECPLGKMLYLEPGYFCIKGYPDLKHMKPVVKGAKTPIPADCFSEYRKGIGEGKELVYFICRCKEQEAETERDLAVVMHKIATGWEEVAYASSKALLVGLIASVGVLSAFELGKAIANSSKRRGDKIRKQ